MADNLTQIGVGGIFALLVIREVLAFLNVRKQANGRMTAGEHTAEFWQADQRKAVAETISITVLPILANQTAILNEMRINNAETNRNIAVMLDRLTQQQRHGEQS